MHLKEEKRCPIKIKSHLQKLFFFAFLSVSVWHANASLFSLLFSFLYFVLLVFDLARTLASSFSEIIFRKMPFFSCFWQKINAFMPWAVLSVQKKAAALIWPLHEWQGFLRRHFCHRSLNLKQEKWFFMKCTMSEKIIKEKEMYDTFNLSNLDKKSML